MVLNLAQVICSYSATCHILDHPFKLHPRFFGGVVGVYLVENGRRSPQNVAICEDELDPTALKTNIKDG